MVNNFHLQNLLNDFKIIKIPTFFYHIKHMLFIHQGPVSRKVFIFNTLIKLTTC